MEVPDGVSEDQCPLSGYDSKSCPAKSEGKKGSYVKVDYQDGAIVVRPVTVTEEMEELKTLRHEAQKKFAEVWRDEDDAIWESYL